MTDRSSKRIRFFLMVGMPLVLLMVFALAVWAAPAQDPSEDEPPADDSTPTPSPTPPPPPSQPLPPPPPNAPPTEATPPVPPAATPQVPPAATPQATPEATPQPPAAEPAAQTEVKVERLNAEQMDQFEESLVDLRERIMKSKARLMQLREQLMLGSVSIISLSINHNHEVGGTFKMESLSYTLDGFEIYSGVNTPENDLEKLGKFPVYEGSLLPGDHLLVVDMIFRGRGYGIFSYLNQYLFKVKARYLFTVAEGDVVNLDVVSYDEGSFLTSLKDRLRVKFEKK
jgi:hypothetical protein